MGRVPVRIVPPYTNVSGGVANHTFGPGGVVLEADVGNANISGGVLPMTQEGYDANTGTNTLLLEDGTPILLEQDGSNLLME
jgi:hypothetical protein